MSKHKKPAHHEPPHEDHDEHAHDDDLVVVPKGTSKLRFLIIMGLMLFVLVIFTVGDQVQNVLGGRAGTVSAGDIAMRWTHPDTNEEFEITQGEYGRVLTDLNALHNSGLYYPVNASDRRARVGDDDVALFYVMDRLAEDAGIEISQEEFVQFMQSRGYTGALVTQQAGRFRMTAPAFEAAVKRTMRPMQLRQELFRAVGLVADPTEVEKRWIEDNPEYKFQYVELNADDFVADAAANLPDDEGLEEWYKALDPGRRSKYFTEIQVAPEVAWIPLDDPDFDPNPLLDAYPGAFDRDDDERANAYFRSARTTRFKYPQDEETLPDDAADDDAADDDAADEAATDEAATDEAATDEAATDADATDADATDADATDEDATDADATDEDATDEDATDADATDADATDADATDADATDADATDADATDADATDADATDAETKDQDAADDEPADPPKPDKDFYDFDEVKDRALAESRLWDALGAFLDDMKSREADGVSEIDWIAEAESLGLRVSRPDGLVSASTLKDNEEWGGSLSRQLEFTLKEQFVLRVTIDAGGLYVGRVADRVDSEEPPFEDRREAMANDWADEHAIEVAWEQLEGLRDLMGVERPVVDAPDEDGDKDGDEDPNQDPDVTADEDELFAGAEDWTPTVDAEAFRQAVTDAGYTVVELPWLRQGERVDEDADRTDAENFFGASAFLYELEAGSVPSARRDGSGQRAYLVRVDGKRDAPLSKMKPEELLRLRSEVGTEARERLEENFMQPSSDAFKQRFSLWLLSEERAQKAAEEEAAGDGAEG